MDAMLLCRTCMKLWFYSYFWADFGIDCRIVLCRVFGMFCAVFMACFVASIGRILWPVDKGCSGVKMVCSGASKELSSTLLRGSHAIAWLGSNPAHLQVSNFGWS